MAVQLRQLRRYLLTRIRPSVGSLGVQAADSVEDRTLMGEKFALAGRAYYSTSCSAVALAELIARHPDLICLDQDTALAACGAVSPHLAIGREKPVSGLGAEESVTVHVTTRSAKPVAGAEVTFFNGTALGDDAAMTDANGRAVLHIRRSRLAGDNVLFVEKAGYWGARVDAPMLLGSALSFMPANTVCLRKIASDTVDPACWGLEAMGLDRVPEASPLGARPVRVAVIHSQSLSVAAPGPAEEFQLDEPDWDYIQSWTKTAAKPPSGQLSSPEFRAVRGVIGAAASSASFHGICLPARPLISDVIKALDWCMRNRMDVVLLSLSIATDNHALRSAIRAMHREGILLIAPAGDLVGKVAFPAAYPEVVGVAAIAQSTRYPESSPHAGFNGNRGRDSWRAASFSAQGRGVTLCGPGVGLTPGADGTVMSGTCLAAAYVAGFAARLFQSTPSLARVPRTAQRLHDHMVALLNSCCDLGLPAAQQGRGMPIWGHHGQNAYWPEKERDLAHRAQLVMNAIAGGSL